MRAPLLALPLLLLALPSATVLAGVPLDCLPPGCVPSTSAAFLPPVLILRDGETVTWGTLDIQHTSTEDATNQVEQPCFNVVYAPTIRPVSVPVAFGFDGAQLTATVGTETRPCTTAQPLPGGLPGAVVSYNCRLHSQMIGEIVVLAA